MKKSILYILISICFLNCKHHIEDDLLPYTEEGLNNFSCLINGKIFKLKNGNPNTNIHSTYYRNSQNLTLICHLPNSNEAIFFDFSKYTLKLGKVELIRPEKRAWYDDENNTQHSSTSGFLNITYMDTVSKFKVLAGTFEVETPKYSITKGRFDFRLSIY